MDAKREQEAVAAYIKFLKNKQVALAELDKRSVFLKIMCHALAAKSLDRNDYARALNIVIKKYPQSIHHSIKFAREFYPFWMQDIKAIATLSQSYNFHEALIEWKPLPATLKSLTLSLAQAQFNELESAALERYYQHLQRLNEEKRVILTKVKLAKIMLLRVRNAPVMDGSLYRIAVDATLPLLRWKKSKQLFLDVVREFFYFWIGQTPHQQQQMAGASESLISTNFPKTSTRSFHPASLYQPA